MVHLLLLSWEAISNANDCFIELIVSPYFDISEAEGHLSIDGKTAETKTGLYTFKLLNDVTLQSPGTPDKTHI